MKSKNCTPIRIFQLKCFTYLSKIWRKDVYVDPTTISKWKSSERPLSSKCDSFDKVVDYVINKNAMQKRNMLENLFCNALWGSAVPNKGLFENMLYADSLIIRQFL